MDIITVAFAEDNEIYFNGLYTLLDAMPGIALRGAAHDGDELVSLLEADAADVVIADVKMPGQKGVETTRTIVQHFPSTKVIGLTMFSTEYLVVELLKAGARGFMDKNTSPEYLNHAIRAVHEGGFYYCPGTATLVSKMILSPKIHPGNEAAFSEHELQLIKLVCQEKSSKEIAGEIYKSESTVDKHRKRIQDKMGVKSVAGMVMYAVRRGLYREEGEG